MENSYLQSRHPVIQLLMLVLITLISVLSVTLLSIIVGMVAFRIPLTDWYGLLDMNDPSNIPVLEFLQITQSLSMFILPPVIFGWFMTRDPWNYLGIGKNPALKPAAAVLAVAVLVLPVINLLSVANQAMHLPPFLAGLERWMERTEAQAADLTTVFLSVETFGGYLVNVLMVVLIPAFGEEFFFRGVLQQVFRKWFRNPHVAIVITAILFSAFHMQFYGFLPRFALGLLFGYLFWWSGNIWYPVIAHGINNFLPVTLTFFFRGSFDPAELDTVGTGPGAWLWAIPGILLGAVALGYFYRQTMGSRKAAVFINTENMETMERHGDNNF